MVRSVTILPDPRSLSAIRSGTVTSLVWRRAGTTRAHSSSSITDIRRIIEQHANIMLDWDATYGCWVGRPDSKIATLMVFVLEPS
jgi:hypothetical protein